MNKTTTTLASHIDTSIRTKFIKENMLDIEMNQTFRRSDSKHRRNNTSNLTMNYTERNMLTQSSNNNIKKKRLKGRVLKPIRQYIGVEEGLIQLPIIQPSADIWRKLTPDEIEMKQSEQISKMIKLQIDRMKDDTKYFEEAPEETNQYDRLKTGENEIKKLNGWDVTHVKSNHPTTRRTSVNIAKFSEAFDSPSLKWFMEIKNNPKEMSLLNRNKHLKEFFEKINTEQKAIFNQSLNINKKQFNFDVFTKGFVKEEKAVEKIGGTTVDYYREVMKDKVKVEDFLKTDLSQVAELLHTKKLKKKRVMQKMVDLISELNNIEGKRKNIVTDSERIARKSVGDKKGKKQREPHKKSTEKEEKLRKQQQMAVFANDVTRKIREITNEKKDLELNIDMYHKELNSIEEEIRHLKMKLNNKMTDHQKYYFDVLKKGIDVRRDGISWILIRLIELKAYIEYSKFPKFLNTEQIEYVLKIAYKQYELSELIKLFQILKKKQKDMREEHYNEKGQTSLENNIEENQPRRKRRDSTLVHDTSFVQERHANEFGELYRKYENVINMCLNEDNEDKYIKMIATELHDKIMKSTSSDETNELDSLYFLPGSLAEFFNESNKFRQYFDDIFYLNAEIYKREGELKEMKQKQMAKYKSDNEGRQTKNSIETEMIFAALFGNGINI